MGIFRVFRMPSLVSRVESFCNVALDACLEVGSSAVFGSFECSLWLLFAPVGRSSSFPYVVSATPLLASGSHPSSPCSFISFGRLCHHPPHPPHLLRPHFNSETSSLWALVVSKHD